MSFRKLIVILQRFRIRRYIGCIEQNINQQKIAKQNMIIVQVKEGENIERALKKFKRKYERTGVVKELRRRQAFEKPSVTNRKKMMKAVYVQQLRQGEE